MCSPLRFAVVVLCFVALAACGGGGGGNGGGAPGNLPRTEYHEFAVADLDGDGFDDLIAASDFFDAAGAEHGSVDVFRRNPASPQNLLPKVSYPIAQVPFGIAVADVNGDGRPDVVVSCSFAESGFRVLLQSPVGGGALGADQFVATTGPVYGIATADIDGDGLTDVVVAMDGKVALFAQQTAAPGTFAAQVTIGDGSRRAIAVDLNADGLIDVAALDNFQDYDNKVVYYLQDPAVPGTFLPVRTIATSENADAADLATGELGGDGKLDIGVSGTRVVTGNDLDKNRKGWWAPQQQRASSPGDFDTEGRYGTNGARDARIAIADIDGDGRDDVVIALRTTESKPNLIVVFLQKPDATFGKGVNYTIPDDAAVTAPDLYAVALRDMNDDGLLDVVVSTNEVFYFPQRAAARGQLAPAVRIAAQR